MGRKYWLIVGCLGSDDASKLMNDVHLNKTEMQQTLKLSIVWNFISCW